MQPTYSPSHKIITVICHFVCWMSQIAVHIS